MSCSNCNCWPCNCGFSLGPGSCGCEVPARATSVPSPDAPWSRERRAANTETLQEAGNVSLAVDPTYLDQALNTPSVPVAIAIADGNYRGQIKTIMIPGSRIATTETWNLTGNIAGYSSLTFNSVGFNAVLQWDGSTYHLIGGNCITNP